MKLHNRIVLPLVAAVCIFGCTSPVARVPPAEDSVLSQEIIGRWLKVETYPYGRFFGGLHFAEDGTGRRDFAVMRQPRSPVVPLISETFRWEIKDGYVVFSQRRVTDVEPESPKFMQTKESGVHKEFVLLLTGKSLHTVDPWGKTDIYERTQSPEAEPGATDNPDDAQ